MYKVIKYCKFGLMLLFPLILVGVLWSWMSPITFWERFAMLFLSWAMYLLVFVVEINTILLDEPSNTANNKVIEEEDEMRGSNLISWMS